MLKKFYSYFSFPDKALEKEYLINLNLSNVKFIRLGLALSYMGWFLVILVSYLYFRVHFLSSVLLISTILFPLFAINFFITYKENLLKYYQPITGLSNLLAALMCLYICYFKFEDPVYLGVYYTWILIFAFFVLRIRFLNALAITFSYSLIISYAILYYKIFDNYETILLGLGILCGYLCVAIPGFMVEKTSRELFLSQKLIEDQKEELLAENELVVKQNISIRDSINYAKRIQSSILPPIAYVDEILGENFIFYKPKDVVSGDFYWIKQVNEFTIFVAADCTGHGVPGAIMSILGISLLNELVIHKGIVQPHYALNELRKKVKISLRQKGRSDESKDGMDIAFCTINNKTKKLSYAGAYNPLILIRNGELIQYSADRMPVGIHIQEKPSFTLHEIDLKFGDVVYIFSDGYPDQMGGLNQKKFKMKKFKELLVQIHNKPIWEQKEILEETLNKWMHNTEQTDDIIVIGVKF